MVSRKISSSPLALIKNPIMSLLQSISCGKLRFWAKEGKIGEKGFSEWQIKFGIIFQRE